MTDKPVVFITGGAGGIGVACARALSTNFFVVIGDHDAKVAIAAAQTLGAVGLECDVTSANSVVACAGKIEAEYGYIHGLVTLAGVIQERHFPPEDFAQDDWDKVLNVNLRGTWISCKEIGSRMARRGQGSIVTISSVAGHRSWPTHAYGPSKAAVMNMTQNLAVEWGRSGVRVNSISPGFTKTGRVEELEASRGVSNDALVRQTALGRWIRPEEVASATAFLLSDASSGITGIDLPVDAGWLAAVNWTGVGAGVVPASRVTLT